MFWSVWKSNLSSYGGARYSTVGNLSVCSNLLSEVRSFLVWSLTLFHLCAPAAYLQRPYKGGFQPAGWALPQAGWCSALTAFWASRSHWTVSATRVTRVGHPLAACTGATDSYCCLPSGSSVLDAASCITDAAHLDFEDALLTCLPNLPDATGVRSSAMTDGRQPRLACAVGVANGRQDLLQGVWVLTLGLKDCMQALLGSVTHLWCFTAFVL